ncbi:ATPase PAAT isoform X3 [Carcharodon carcharias]|uniref:ATPase PAAT isoform X3 n=1 Tax=Carcharodon carcharias TaxID=13397 RepID=UPI001B7E664E|nr:ATPase PAAT isoform X3 [Carcharodon carcharias]
MEPVEVRTAWSCGTGRLRATIIDWNSERGEAGVRAELVTLERPQTNTLETPCVLYLQCSSQHPADIAFVEVLSEARTMEVYTGEYCGTSQGQRVDNLQINGEQEQILLFKKCFKLDFPSSFCELKLLSLGGKERVRIGKILLGIKYPSVRISRGFSPLGKNINLERVQTMMDSMGAKLSPGAQQLFNMVQFQQKDLCGQVNELRMGEKVKNAAAEDCGRHYQQNFCSELEKHIAEHMESIEKRLKDYIDCRINMLQVDLDEKFVSLTNLLENIALNRTVTKSYERDTILTNGEL